MALQPLVSSMSLFGQLPTEDGSLSAGAGRVDDIRVENQNSGNESFSADASSTGEISMLGLNVESEEDEDSDKIRPNRFRGRPERYRKFIAEERGLLDTLFQLRADDLSIHLYNAYVLKDRLRRGLSELNSTDRIKEIQPKRSEHRKEWYPTIGWTSWPLRPEVVPKPGQRFGIPLTPENGSHRIPNMTDWETEIRECLGAMCLRFAKEIWVAKGGFVNGPAKMEAEHNQACTAGAEQMIVMADDEKAFQSLESTVRSITAHADQLLERLHHTRKKQYGLNDFERVDAPRPKRRRKATATQSSSLPQSAALTRAGGRPRKYHQLQEGESYYHMHRRLAHERTQAESQPAVVSLGHSSDSNSALKREPTKLPTRYKEHRLPGESLYQMHRRLHATSEDENDDQERNLAEPEQRPAWKRPLRDWQDVLNAATFVGWDEEVVKETRRRCEALLGHDPKLHKQAEATSKRPIGNAALLGDVENGKSRPSAGTAAASQSTLESQEDVS